MVARGTGLEVFGLWKVASHDGANCRKKAIGRGGAVTVLVTYPLATVVSVTVEGLKTESLLVRGFEGREGPLACGYPLVK